MTGSAKAPIDPTDLLDFVDTAAVGLHWVGADGTILWANRADYEPLGFTEDEYIGHSITEFHADHDVIADVLRRLRGGERLNGYEARLRCKDGSIRLVEITSSVRFDELPTGRVFRHTRCFTVDVTPRKIAERRLRFVTDALPALVAYVGADQRYVFVNQAYEHWFGVRAEDLIGRHVRDVLGHAAYELLRERIAAVLAGEQVMFEAQLPYPGVGLRDVKATYIPEFVTGVRDASGQRQVAGYVGLIIDVTEERRRAAQLASLADEVKTREAEYRRLADSLPDLVARFDRDYRHLYVNPAVTRAIGLPAEALIGKTNRDLEMPEDHVARWEAAFARAFRGETVRLAFDYPSPDGTRHFESQLVPERDASDDIVSILAVTRDVTDARRALARAESMRAQLEDASRAKDAFLAMLGHELRNPLAPILTAVQLMQLRAPDSLVKERATIERQLQHMVRLVDDLLDVSRITQGKIELRKRPLDVNETIAKALEQAGPLLEQRAHRVTMNLESDMILVEGDEIRLAQVFANLLTNAAKYTPPNGEITVRSRRDGERVIVEVTDNGSGIAPDLLPDVFTFFVQGTRTIERTEGGLGLGLAIVRNLVEMHGGTVQAASPGLGQGSTFTVVLPLLSAGARVALPPLDATIASASPTGLRVLIVDDNRDAADLLADMLASLGHETAVAYDGFEAIQQFERFSPDVGLVDIGLPVMDGFEVARRIRASANRQPKLLVAITGYGQDGDRERVLQAGFAEHLVKPVDVQRVTRMIDESARRA